MRILGWVLLIFTLSVSSAHAQNTVTRLFRGRGAGVKTDITIVGEGFTAAQQGTFNNYVQQEILGGLFKSSPFMESMNAFNINRINAISAGAGVTRITETVTVLAPDLPANGIRTTFAWNVNSIPAPLLNNVKIIDPANTTIVDNFTGTTLSDPSNTVTGTVNLNTGVVTLNYPAGSAPPAGNFTFTFGQVTNVVNTPLNYRYSGTINRCWMEPSPGNPVAPFVSGLVPGNDLTIVVLNVGTPGVMGAAMGVPSGCNRGDHFGVPVAIDPNGDGDSSDDWIVVAHEAGHLFGKLCDEYINGAGVAYNRDLNLDGVRDEFSCANLSATSARAAIKWAQWIDPKTTLPTVFNPMTMTASGTVGAFVGGGGIQGPGGVGFNANAWRPTNNDRMNSNTPNFSPVSYDWLRQQLDPSVDHNFQQSYVGDFNNDGMDDLVVHSPGALDLYISDGKHLVPTWTSNQDTDTPNWERFLDNDQFVVGDFDGDGMDDLFVFNATDWDRPYFAMLKSTGTSFSGVRRFASNLPGWQMTAGDQFISGDFDGDGLDDLAVSNFGDWVFGYFAVFRSLGTDLAMVHRYDDNLPSWEMRANDKYVVGDFNGDNRDDIGVLNTTNWSLGYLGILVSTGDGLALTARYDGSIQGWDQILSDDQIYVANFDGDADDDLFIFNGADWAIPYLAQLAADDGQLTRQRRFDGVIPGWEMARNDRFFVADTRGDGLDDLYVFNGSDWFSPYLGTLVTTAEGDLSGSWQVTSIGKWTLANSNKLLVADFNGGGRQDLVISDSAVVDNEALALLRSQGGRVKQTVMYPRWIVDHPYNSNGWW